MDLNLLVGQLDQQGQKHEVLWKAGVLVLFHVSPAVRGAQVSVDQQAQSRHMEHLLRVRHRAK